VRACVRVPALSACLGPAASRYYTYGGTLNSSKALKAGQSVLTTPTDSTRDSTPVPSVPATPQQQPRSLKSPKPKPPPSKQPPSKGDLSKLSLSQLSQQQQQLEEQLSKLTKGDLGKVSQQQQQQLELHLGTKLKGPVSRPL